MSESVIPLSSSQDISDGPLSCQLLALYLLLQKAHLDLHLGQVRHPLGVTSASPPAGSRQVEMSPELSHVPGGPWLTFVEHLLWHLVFFSNSFLGGLVAEATLPRHGHNDTRP